MTKLQEGQNMASESDDITSLMAKLQLGENTDTAAASERILPAQPSAPLPPAPAVDTARQATQSNRPLRQLLKLEDAWTFSL